MTTPNLVLPELVAGQTGAETTHNQALNELDVLLQGLVLDRNLTTPPGSPAAGDTYIPLATATGDWTGHEDDIAWFDGVAWQFKVPNEGWSFRVADENIRVQWDGAAWVDILAGAGGGMWEFVDKTTLGSPSSTIDVGGFDSSVSVWRATARLNLTLDASIRARLGLASSFKTDAFYRFHVQQQVDNVGTYQSSVATAGNEFLIPFVTAEATTEKPYFVEFTIVDPAKTDRRKLCRWEGQLIHNGQRPVYFDGGGTYDGDNTAFDEIRFLLNTGSFDTGSEVIVSKRLEA